MKRNPEVEGIHMEQCIKKVLPFPRTFHLSLIHFIKIQDILTSHDVQFCIQYLFREQFSKNSEGHLYTFEVNKTSVIPQVQERSFYHTCATEMIHYHSLAIRGLSHK